MHIGAFFISCRFLCRLVSCVVCCLYTPSTKCFGDFVRASRNASFTTATMEPQQQHQQQLTAVQEPFNLLQQLHKQLPWSQGVLPHGWPAAAAPWVASSSNAQFIVSVVVAAAMGIVLHGSSTPVAPWCPMLSSTIHWLMS
jgi:hypothetical protein